VALIVLVPACLVHLIPTDAPQPFVFRATLTTMLAESDGGKLRYYEAHALEGAAPATDVVLALDRAYSRGYQETATMPGVTVWIQGSLMTPDIFYGEQYLFFNRPQVYVRQVKSGLLWPDQWSGLRALYLSPFITPAAPIQLPWLLRSAGLQSRIVAVLLARCLLLAALIVTLLRRRPRGGELASYLLLYGLLAIVLSALVLGDLY